MRPVGGRHPILVMDDEPTIRENLRRLLTSTGYEVTTAENGDTALERAAEQSFEVALLDIGMPGISGIDVLKQLRAQYPDTAVIMVTAVVELETAIEAMRLGAYDYVSKPFNLDDVLIRVSRAREHRDLTIQLREFQEFLEEKVKEQAKRIHEITISTVRSLGQSATSATPDSGVQRFVDC